MADPPGVALLAHRLGAGVATGIGRYYREVAVGLAAVADPERVSYTLATPRETSPPEWARPPLRYVTLRGPRRPLQISWSLFGRPRVDQSLGHPSLVHTLHSWVPTPTRAPLVVTIHDVMPLVNPGFYPAHHRFGLRRGIAHARDHAARIVVDSAWIADLVESRVGVERDRITVVHLGVAPRFREPVAPAAVTTTTRRYGVEPGRYLLAVGAVSARKNLVVVAEALALLDPKVLGPVALLVAGPDDLGATDLRADLDRLGLAARVRFGGYVPDPDLPPLLAGSLALVHPSLDEGFGFTPLEAMAVGTPAIVSTSGSLPEVVGDAGVLLAPADPTPWAETIERVAADADFRANLVRAGTHHQERFTWARTATETMGVHLQVLGD